MGRSVYPKTISECLWDSLEGVTSKSEFISYYEVIYLHCSYVGLTLTFIAMLGKIIVSNQNLEHAGVALAYK